MKFKSLLIFTIVCLNAGCEEVKIDSPPLKLEGKWNVYKATRNNKATKTLEGGYFVFEHDKTMKTNIFGNENLFKFEKKDGLLITTEGEPKLNLKLDNTHADSLTLKGKIKYFNFEFFLVRDTVK